MKIISSFKHLEHTEAIDQRIQEKSKKLKKYFDGNFEVHWTCSVVDGGQKAEIKLLGPNIEYHASAHSETLYKSLDLVVAKIEKQLHKQKDKWRKHIGHKHSASLKEIMNLDQEHDDDYEDYSSAS